MPALHPLRFPRFLRAWAAAVGLALFQTLAWAAPWLD
jgi:hypothetical protein